MKQSLPIARAQTAVITMMVVAQISLSVGCVRLPRRNVVQAQPQISNTEKVVNINTASTQDLAKLPGIGNAIAERIVAHREQYGPFRRPEHLMMVRGISDQKFRPLRPRIKVE